MRKLWGFSFLLSFVSVNCSSPPAIYIPSGIPTGCAEGPVTAVIDPPSCVTASGKWTFYDYNISTNHGLEYCNETDADHYPDQAAFNAAHSSGMSGNDYVVSAGCASGTALETSGSVTSTHLFIWKKVE